MSYKIFKNFSISKLNNISAFFHVKQTCVTYIKKAAVFRTMPVLARLHNKHPMKEPSESELCILLYFNKYSTLYV